MPTPGSSWMLKPLPSWRCVRSLPQGQCAHFSSLCFLSPRSAQRCLQSTQTQPPAFCLDGSVWVSEGRREGPLFSRRVLGSDPRPPKPLLFISTRPPRSCDSPVPETQADALLSLDLLFPGLADHMPLSEEKWPPPHADILIYHKTQMRQKCKTRNKQIDALIFHSQTSKDLLCTPL